jgi:hypothetical protein
MGLVDDSGRLARYGEQLADDYGLIRQFAGASVGSFAQRYVKRHGLL